MLCKSNNITAREVNMKILGFVYYPTIVYD